MGFWDTPPPWGVDPGLPPGYQPPPEHIDALSGPPPSHNYVSFRDDIIEILRKYGLAGLGLAGYGAAQNQGQPAQ